MKNKWKSTDNWKEHLWKSLDEQDVMQLRSKLNDIHIQTENELQSYNMNSVEDFKPYV
ncbi:MAG: hypothetical protein LC658_12640 [Bacteroidales bacterium]|nr:hypothetical protein [Bacteroidales bacterium]